MKIYTRTGDRGDTGLLGGIRLSKSALRVDAYGEIDELNASLGVARLRASTSEARSMLEEIQRDLFSVGALLADPNKAGRDPKVSLDPSSVQKLESHIDLIEASLPPLRRFILPGGSAGGALLHLARAICRRAERRVVALGEREEISPAVVPYLNRLSDLLFVLARYENEKQGAPELPW